MKGNLIWLGLADLVLVVFAYFVLQDLDWRSSYASIRGYSLSMSYSLLTRVSTLSERGSALRSPLTLDWIQVVVALLIILNLGYVFGATRHEGSASPAD